MFRPSNLDHAKAKVTPNPLWMQDSSTLEHVYAYIMDGINDRERTVFRAWFIATCKGIMPSENVHITLDRLQYSFDSDTADKQSHALEKVKIYVADYTAKPDKHAQILERLLVVQSYFEEHLKNKPSSVALK